MKILFFKVRGHNVPFVGTAADQAERRARGFLHNIAQLACKQQLTRAGINGNVNLQGFTADARPGKAGGGADFIFQQQLVSEIFRLADKLSQIGLIYRDCRTAVFNKPAGALAQKLADLPLQ